MRRRILSSIIAVTILAVVLFGVPLAIVVRDQYLADATLRLEREATTAARQVPADVATRSDPVELSAQATSTHLGLYLPDGQKLAGRGPTEGDAPVQAAAANRIQDIEANGRLVVAVPVLANEQVIAVMRADRPLSVVDHEVREAWIAMAGIAIAAVAVAALVAHQQARRLSRPIEAVRRAAHRLGDGDFTIARTTSGISELDDVSDALAATAQRLDSLLSRERAFSADASHQLRTPLTGLRLILESELAAPRTDHRVVLDDALREVDRLEATIDELLTLARDTSRDRGPLDLPPLFDELERRWRGPLAASGRRLRIQRAELAVPTVRASRSAVTQVLEVLLDNALRHGAGTVTLEASGLETGIAITVRDEGNGSHRRADELALPTAELPGHGIGLTLASRLAEAEGGRLLCPEPGEPSAFQLLLPAGGTVGAGAPRRAGRPAARTTPAEITVG